MRWRKGPWQMLQHVSWLVRLCDTVRNVQNQPQSFLRTKPLHYISAYTQKWYGLFTLRRILSQSKAEFSSVLTKMFTPLLIMLLTVSRTCRCKPTLTHERPSRWWNKHFESIVIHESKQHLVSIVWIVDRVFRSLYLTAAQCCVHGRLWVCQREPIVFNHTSIIDCNWNPLYKDDFVIEENFETVSIYIE